MNIAAWLKSLGFEQYVSVFDANAIDAEILPTLTSEDLKEIGVAALAHRKRILEAIAILDRQPDTPPEQGATASNFASIEAEQSRGTDRPREAERRQLTVMFVDLV